MSCLHRTARITLMLALAVTLGSAGCGQRNDITAPGPEPVRTPEPAAAEPAVAEPAPPDEAIHLDDTTYLEVTVEGETEHREAQLWISPQNYAIYVLPQIVMTAEEPNRDQAFARIDGEFFVRIERLGPEPTAYYLRNNARLALRDIGRVHKLEGEQIFDPLFREAELFMHASNPKVSVNILVIDIDGGRFRFTMHMPNREAAEGIMPSFWAMLRSIRTVGPRPDDAAHAPGDQPTPGDPPTAS